MLNTYPTTADIRFLNAFADSLMWIGKDLAADAVYAEIEAATAVDTDPTAGTWDDVFEGSCV